MRLMDADIAQRIALGSCVARRGGGYRDTTDRRNRAYFRPGY